MKTKIGDGLNQSFTLIEIIVVLAIMGLMTGLVLSRYNDFTQTKLLSNNVRRAIDILELAKKKANSGDASASCTQFNGYKFLISSTTRFSLNKNCESNVDTLIQIYNLDGGLQFKNGANESVLFRVLSRGAAISTGANPYIITIKNTAVSPAKCSDITVIPETGLIDISGTEGYTAGC